MGAEARLTGIAPQLVVPDVVRTAEYYRDKLGFELLGYFANPPVFAMVRRDNAEIHFGKIDVGSQMRFNEPIRKGLGSDVYIFVSDIHALYEEFVERGAQVVEGPIKRIYNCTEITVKDCNGYQLVFGE
jgi:catechol 2,3-dioxygenase-like lactoylglutathione lyase family enzyme